MSFKHIIQRIDDILDEAERASKLVTNDLCILYLGANELYAVKKYNLMWAGTSNAASYGIDTYRGYDIVRVYRDRYISVGLKPIIEWKQEEKTVVQTNITDLYKTSKD